MNKYLAGSLSAFTAAVIGFLIHVGSQEWVRSWVSAHMQGRAVIPSWDVRCVALLTSLETGIGLVVLYALIRPALPRRSSLLRGVVLGVLLLAVMGRLFRQPAMNLVIGNPLPVVAVQDGISWVLWTGMSVVVAAVYDALSPADAS
ncbi:hypothetical protein [Ramlibacter sp.]|uniref:hypothetical protein n=1 Tax=Ramlibacter sp. TaxID=1917967 RepID=UPI002CF79B6A|nr:hypothetical protein [Ramlibacter sp.]HWI83667.1 hypothetical protein [Ramlibacter sp.]